jgi:hypothetical protein
MGMRQHNADNRQTQLAGRLHNRLRLPAHVGVDQGETIILAHQKAIEGHQARQLKQVVAVSGHFHDLVYPFC